MASRVVIVFVGHGVDVNRNIIAIYEWCGVRVVWSGSVSVVVY